jgi:hypothetical protein|tara:strand:+ start:2717 stop:3907 length:1191 start_codon:yes stop_codon:yes gene_type:complete
MEDNKKQEVENTEEVLSEGGDMKAPAKETKEEKPKKESALQEDGSYKVDLKQSSTNKTENDALREKIKDDKKSNEEEEQVEEKEEVDSPVLEEVTDTDSEEPVKQEVKEPVVENTKEKTPEMELPENVEKLVKFMNETGGTIDDYVKLNTDYSKLEDSDLLKSYYQQTKGHLSGEEIDFLIEDRFNFDEDADDPRDIKRKKLAYKEAVAEARNALETTKNTYFEELKLGSRLTKEQQKAVDFFNRYNKEQGQANELAENQRRHFNNETDKVFNENFKGFDFQVGDKKYRYNVKDAQSVKENQMEVMNLFRPFMGENNFIKDPTGYHKSIFAASNADAIANHFYEQGKADAIKNMTSEAKNINMDRKTDTGSVKPKSNVRLVSGDDSSKLKFKLKNY